MKRDKVPPPVEEPRRLGRRELVRIAAASATAVGVVGAGLLLYDRKPGSAAPATIRDHRVERPQGSVQLAIARGPDPVANLRKALEAVGGMGAFVRPGERVVVKPNVGWNRLPEQAANTDPKVVEEVVRQVFAAGAAKVWVTDNSVNNAERCFERSGIRKAVGAAGGTVVLPESNAFREVSVGGQVIKTAEVLWPFVEADKLINVPVAKHHGLSRATMALKNWYGVLGGHRVRLHQNLSRCIVDLAAMMKPTLTILDGTRVMMANGPTGGNLADVKRADTIAVSTDEVAIDAFGAGLLGLAPEDLEFIAEAERAGLGVPNLRALAVAEIPG